MANPNGRPALPLAELLEKNTERIPFSDCHIWNSSCDSSGYGHTRQKGVMKKAHRLSYELHKGEIPSGMHVLHKCDNTSCINPDHLFIGTHAENMRDKARKLRGSKKLTKEDVLLIREDKRSNRKLASCFGVSQSTIGDIRSRKTWAFV